MFKRLRQFFVDIKAEFVKVSWPTKQQTLRNTYIVVVFVIMMSIFLGVLNVIFSRIIKFLF